MLSRRQPEPGREIATLCERGGVADGSQERGGVDRPDSRDRRQPSRLIIIAGQHGEFVVVGTDPPVQARPLSA